MGLPRVEEVFEMRPPKTKAIISQVDGKVISIERSDNIFTIKIQPEINGKKSSKAKSELLTYDIPYDLSVLVQEGSTVKAGDPLCEGSIDLRELYRVAGQREVERQVVFSIQQVYTFQGAPIHDKHIEVIVRQMFSRVRVKEAGDTNFSIGEIVEKGTFLRMNREVLKRGAKPARAVQLLLGITKVATTTDSFLSAASFQETTRILISAAVEGKVDTLRGLKENVIIGRLIPAGTGYKQREEK
jgi:DNA-directed RNA polymerase subunit beta'